MAVANEVDQFVTIDSNLEIVRDKFMRIMTQIPEIEEAETEDVAEIFKEEMVKYLQANRDSTDELGTWRGELMNSINIFDVPSSGDGTAKGISIDKYNNGTNIAAWHEYAEEGHFVNPDNTDNLRDWIDDKDVGSDPVGGSGSSQRNKRGFYVSPSPFVKPVVQSAAERLRDHVKQGGKVSDILEQELR